MLRWKYQIAAWHTAHVSNGPTEAANNLIKRVKRAAFGFTSFRNYAETRIMPIGRQLGAVGAGRGPCRLAVRSA
jgi:hypothetical protein